MKHRRASRCQVLVTLALVVLVAVVTIGGGQLIGTLKSVASRRSWTRATSSLEMAVNEGFVTASYADKVDAGEITQAQAETLTVLDEREGTYDERSIVLQGVGRERAEELASRLGAMLRITKDGSYARLTLPEDTSISDVLSDAELAAYAPDVEPDWYVEVTAIDEDDSLGFSGTDLSRDSAVTFDDPYYQAQSYLAYINAANTLASDTESSSLVAVIDTGIDWESPEFAGRISDRSYNATEDKVVADHGWDVVTDEQGHGTAVAGVLAAASNNAAGIVGVASEAQLLVIKADCDRAGRFAAVSDLVFGLYYAVEQGASVVNMSFGTYAPYDPFASAVKLAVDSDVALVASAGNDATAEACWPAANPDVVGVGALGTGSWEIAPYSNFGEDDVDMVAPGSVVTLLAGQSGGVAITASSGTSFSAPIVAGAVARYKASVPHAENAQVVARLRASSTDLGEAGRDWYFGYGALDLDSFLNGQEGVITFDMLTDEVEDATSTFIVGKALQSVPEPERESAMFDGWYHDDQLEEAYDHETEKLYGEAGNDGVPRLTVYAGWTNEDDGQPFTWQAADGADPTNGIEVTGYRGKRRYMVVPDLIDGYTVVGIADGAFEGNGTIVTASLPVTLTRIGDRAFAGCVRLTSVDVPDAVEAVGREAFRGCARLQRAGFGEGSALASLGELALADCPSLRSLRLGRLVGEFDGSALLGDTALTSVSVDEANASFALASDGVSVVTKDGKTLVYHPAGSAAAYATPEGVTAVGPYALAYSRAAEVVVSDGVAELGAGALLASSSGSVSLPESLERLGQECFARASGLSSLDMSATGVREIPAKAFAMCAGLAEVRLPSGLEGIGESAFESSGLASVELPAGVASVDDAAFRLTPLRSATLSAALTDLGEYIFADCYALTTVAFPDRCALEEVPAHAFSDTPALGAVELPPSLVAVREHAFHGSGLASVAVPASVATIEQGAFADCPRLAHVTVADGNAAYSAVDDVLLDAAGQTLVLYPAGREGEAYELPGTVRSIAGYAFQGARNLRSVTLPAGMSELSSYAFSRCRGLEEAVLPEGLDIINVNAFEYCTSLSSVHIPASVRTVARYAFYCDYALGDVSFDEGSLLSRVGFAAFAYSGLTDVTLPASVGSMGQYAFAGCTGLTSFALADGSALASMPAYTFDGCEALTSISFGRGCALRSLTARSLEGLPALNTVDLSGCTSLTSVGNYALNRCFALSDVRLPASTQSIGRYAFYGCTSLATLSVPAAVSFIGRYAFTSCAPVTLYFEAATLPAELQDDWNYGIGGYYLGTAGGRVAGDWVVADAADGTVAAVRYNGSASEVDATSIDGRAVSSIGYGCFRDNAAVTRVALGDELATICDYAFAGTAALEAVDVPAGVTYVGDHAFEGSGVGAISFAEGSALERVGDFAFAGTGNLSAVQIPASVERVGRAAFKGSAVSDVTFADGSRLSYVGRQAFQESGVSAIALPDTIAEIDDYAFYNAKSLASLDLGDPTDLKIQTHAFYGTALTSVRIPAGVSYIGELAFDAITELTGIEVDADNPNYAAEDGVLYDDTRTAIVSYPAGRTGEVVIPANVTSIRFGAFEHANVTSVRFEEGSKLTTIGYRAFYGCDSLTSFEVPAGVTSIDRYAFAECDNLVTCDVSRAKSLAGIYQGAFYNDARLSGFALPDSVQEVGDRAFYGCSALSTEVPATGGLRAIGDGAFARSGVTALAAPANLLTIGAEAFRGSALRDLDLDNGVLAEIGAGAFADCADFSTAELVIPDSVDYIGYGALASGRDVIEGLTMPVPSRTDGDASCTAAYLYQGEKGCQLKRVTISAAEELPERMFMNCEALESARLPLGVAEIPELMFESCVGLKSVQLPESIRRIGDGAFRFTSLEDGIELHEGLISIGNSAFSSTKLPSISLPESLTSIGSDAFYASEIGPTIRLGKRVENIGSRAFGYCKELCGFQVADENTVYSSDESGCLYNKEKSELLQVPCGLNGEVVVQEGVKKIGPSALEGASLVHHVKLPETLQEIGSAAFMNSGLEEIEIPGSIQILPERLLAGTGVRRVVIAEGVERIPDFFMSSCEYLEEIVLPSTLRSIGVQAFGRCQAIESIELPNSLEEIGEQAFSDCVKLRSLSLNEGIKTIGNGAYSGCQRLTEVTLPSGNDSYRILDGSLYTHDMKTLVCGNPSTDKLVVYDGTVEVASTSCSCGAMNEVVIPDTVTTIGYNAFHSCENLNKVRMSKAIQSIGYDAFVNSKIVNDAISAGEPAYIDTVLYRIPVSLEEVNVKEGTTFISESLVGSYTNSSLKRVSLPSTLLVIDENAFWKTSLTEIVIPASVQRIEYGAFQVNPWTNDASIRSVVFEDGFRGTVSDGAFYGQEHISNIVIPTSAVLDSGGVLAIDTLLRGLNCENKDGLTITLLDSQVQSKDIDINVTGSTIYCYEDPRSTLWHEGWEGDNTVYYLGDWDMATFMVDGRVVASGPVRAGEVVEAPSEAEVKASLADACDFRFLGWDADGDGGADALPTTLSAHGSLTAEALYTTHTWGEGVTVEPTCTEAGSLTRTCSTCGKSRVEAIDPLGHDFVAGEVVAPTEAEDGYTAYVCSRCGEAERRDWVIATGAEPSDWTVTVPATCEGPGEEARLTPSGHPLETRVVEALGHAWDDGTITTEPTCLATGVRTYVCKNDQVHQRTEAVPALGHDWGDWETVAEATYEAPGTRRRVCGRCGEAEEQEVPRLEWVDAGGVSMSVSSLELKAGESTWLKATLANPDASDPRIAWSSSDESVAVVDASGLVTAVGEGVAWVSATATDGTVGRCQVNVIHEHLAGEAVRENEVAATCEAPGSYELATYCSRCGEELSREKVEAAPALGHVAGEAVRENEVEPGCIAAGRYDSVVRCSRCSEELSRETVAVPALGHDWGDWETVAEATYEAPGTRRRVCGRCGEAEEQEVPRLEWVDAGGVSMSVSSLELTVGEIYQLTAELANPDATDPAVAWVSSDEAVATVDGSGLVTAVSAGVATITATATDGTNDRCQAIVIDPQADADAAAAAVVDTMIDALPLPSDLAISDASAVSAAREAYRALTEAQRAMVKGLATLEAAEVAMVDTLIAALPLPGDLTQSDAPAVSAAREAYEALSVDQRLMVKGLETLEAAEAYLSNAPQKDISGCALRLSQMSFTYDGTEKKPTVTLKDGDKTLTEGTDYELSYANNVDPGTATVTITGKGNYAGTASATFAIVKQAVAWKRLAGNGRYDTMAEIVQEGWAGQTGGTVVVATGEGFKDALAAAGLAGLDEAPVVLTAGKSLSKQAEAQLRALNPSKVYVAGGTFAVSDGVLSSIKKVTGVRPTRVFGQTSASTSAALAIAGMGRWGDTAIIATNKSFKDALSVAPVSYAKHWPILLADNGKSINDDVIKALKDCGIKHAYIVGGTAAVTPNVEEQLKRNGVDLADRLAGANGIETSRAIADFALENGLTVANMAFATSLNFPDALGGAALCGKNASVLLLCNEGADGNLSFATERVAGIDTGYVFGGTYAFSERLYDRLLANAS